MIGGDLKRLIRIIRHAIADSHAPELIDFNHVNPLIL